MNSKGERHCPDYILLSSFHGRSLASLLCLSVHSSLTVRHFCDIYFSMSLSSYREYLALNVYVALCYYKLDYYDVSQEVLAVYLQQIPDSTIALNLKACNHFRLYNGKAAEVGHGCVSISSVLVGSTS